MRDVPLADVGGKGLFVSELEQAVRDGRADLAVHSLKDVPAELAAGLVLGCVPQREDPRDVLVTTDGVELDELAAGERVGTSSLRRRIQLQRAAQRPRVRDCCAATSTRAWPSSTPGSTARSCWPTRGCGGSASPDRPLWPIPVAIWCRRSARARSRSNAAQTTATLRALLARLEHAPSRVCVEAERAFLTTLGGDCHTPLAGHARFEDGSARLRFDGLVASVSDTRMVRAGTEHYTEAKGQALIAEARALGTEAARTLLEQGAGDFIREAAAQAELRRDPRTRPSTSCRIYRLVMERLA